MSLSGLKRQEDLAGSALSLATWLRLAKASRIVERELSRRLRLKHGHGMARFDVLSQLARSKDRWVAVGKLSKQLLSEHSGITRLIDRMIEDGLVERRSHPDDRRSIQVAITRSGRNQFNTIASDHANWADEVFGLLGEEDCGRLNDLLSELVSKCLTSEKIETYE